MSAVIGTVPYLNAEPLTAAWRSPDFAPGVEVRAEVPSRLAESLRSGELDAALVSVAAVLPDAGLRLLPGYGVASRERVRSIQLYFTRPLDEARIVALDASSRSAQAQVKTLFGERFGRRPEYVERPPKLAAMLAEADCALLIGNPALQANQRLAAGAWDGPPLEQLDVGDLWRRHTGLPFVYAAWACPADRDPAPLLDLLARAAEWGIPRAAELARTRAAEVGIPEAVAVDYLTRAIHYRLDDADERGMERFLELGRRQGVFDSEAAVRWAMPRRPAR